MLSRKKIPDSSRWIDDEKRQFLREYFGSARFPFFDRNFLAFLSWPLCAFTLAAIGWIILLSNLNERRQEVDRRAETEVATLAKTYSVHLSHTLDAIDQILLHVRYEWELTDGRLDLAELKAKGLFAAAATSRVSILDRTGKILSRSYMPEGPRRISPLERPYFAAQANSTKDLLFIDLPAVESTSKTLRMRFSRKLFDSEANFDGVALINISAEYFTESYDGSILGPHGFLGMARDDGHLLIARTGGLVHPPDSPALVVRPGIAQLSRSGGLGANHQWFSDKRSRYVAWHPVKGYPVVAMAGLDAQDALAPFQNYRAMSIRNAGLVSLCLTVMTFIAMFLTLHYAWRRYQLDHKQASYRRATEQGSEGFYICRPLRDRHRRFVDFEILDCNSQGAAFYRRSREDLIGRKISSLYDRSFFPQIMKSFCQAWELGFFESELEVFDESRFTAHWINLKMVRSDENLALTIRDASEKKRHAAELRSRIDRDELTGLQNRHWLQQTLQRKLQEAARENRKLAVLFVDLDGFKSVNEMYGLTTGDELLLKVASRLKAAVDHQVVRLGGDEFAVVVENFEHFEYASHVAESLLQALSEYFILSNATLSIHASIGISVFPEDGLTVQEILQNADCALYSAKVAGRGHYRFFEPHFQQELRARHETRMALKLAIERDQFIVYYQPRIDLSTGLVCSLEALVRWLHPSKGILGPLEFIPLAEESKLIVEIGELVIDKVCAQVSYWEKQGQQPVPVSINVSARQFNETDVARVFSSALTRHGIAPDLIEIEITESSMMGGHEEFSSAFSALQKMGIKVLVDDFGTGYSSLSQLQQLNFDVLKVDIAFTSKLEKSEEGKIFFRAIITMAHALGMRVVAEGVENENQVNILKSLACDEVQGFYFSRPLPPANVQPFVQSRLLLKLGDLNVHS
jgi:diguanylate cyclase (GGDEF)-like protein